MKSKLVKSSVFLFMFTVLALFFSVSASAADGYTTEGDFTYYVSGNYAAVTEYKGTAANVVVPSKIGSAYVINIADRAFSSNKTMKSISLPSTILSIGKASFNECTGLTKVVLPSKLQTIGDGAFWYCTGLTAIYIPPSVTSIAKNSFTGCTNLTGYVIPGSYAEKFVYADTTVTLGYRYATSVKLAATKATLTSGTVIQTKYAVYPANCYNKKVVFTSSNSSVVSTTATGLLTAKGCGTAVITATTADGSNKKAQVVITVVPGPITSFKQTGVTVDGYTVSWSKSPGATGYGIYTYNAGTKKWVLLKTTSALSYTVTGLSAGASEYYRILPYTVIAGKYFKGPATSHIKASVLAPGKITDIKTKSNDSQVLISWAAAPNATGYQIYLHNLQTDSYSYLTKTEKLSVTFKNLKPNTEYVYAIRAFLLQGGTMVVSNEFVDHISVWTTPGKVDSFGVDSDSVTTTGGRLVWNKLKGVSGYEIYSYDESAAYKYTLVARLPHEAITGYTVDDLTQGEMKKYVIRAYVDTDVPLYGPISAIATLQTAMLPKNHTVAFGGFIDALNTTKFSGESFYLIKTTEVSNLSGLHTDTCKDILNTIAHTNVAKYTFENGIEKKTALPIGNFIQPYNLETKLALSQVKSCNFTPDGNGYRITVTLAEEQLPAAVNSTIAPVIDWGVVAGQHKGFSIKYCLYEGTTIEAKVQNGRIDDMQIIMPMNYTFTLGGTEYTFSETITQNYIFGW